MLRMAANTLTILSLLCIKLTAIKGAPTSECCQSKQVGNTTYVLVNQSDTSDYNCLDSCIYEDKQVSGSRFCFQEGDLPVKCLEDQVLGCKCGIKKKPRIIGGKEMEVNEFPWLVALSNEDGNPFCGGTLVASQWVVTASHCLWKDDAMTIPIPIKDLRITLGEHIIGVSDESEITKMMNAQQYTVHPNWSPDTADGDIAMIMLAEEVDLKVYTPACLANTGDDFSGKKAWVYGWGTTDPEGKVLPPIPTKIQVPIVSNEVCQAKMTELGNPKPVLNGQLCAGGVGGEDSCKGDSGGPLTLDIDGQHTLVGSVSLGIAPTCAGAGFYAYYSDIGVYRNWLDETMASAGNPTVCPA